ncbi:1-acyl-sn-glycerol-3-phosphate acyltransferase [Alkalilimnicola sp. S0819]|nr:1-acyl-sn-glycerol-3-phosphate acyltransferase [Alkalilimnicola sp. S0819]MPQ17375.1 1-acyl-sn-glycerol-3-phosphate acyltransferase [Alkalilimnicola sp. S0819]
MLRSTLQFAFMIGSVLTMAFLGLFTFPFPYRWRYWFITRWTFMNLWFLRRVVGLDSEVQGTEHIPDTPCIVMAKHQSTWETLGLQQWFRPQTWVLKRELTLLPLFGWALKLLDPIAIDRKAGRDAVQQVVDKGRARLLLGRWVVVFPEGTRVLPGSKGRYRIGGAVLAEQTGVPVIPVAHNAGDFWARHQFVKRPGKIQVRIGPPIDTAGLDAGEIRARVEAWIEGEMTKIQRQ